MGYNPKITMGDCPKHLAGAVCTWPADPISIYIYEPVYLQTSKKLAFKHHWFGLNMIDALHLRRELDEAIRQARGQERQALRILRGGADEAAAPSE